MNTIAGNGKEYDINMVAGSSLLTTTSQYKVVAMVPNTTTAANYTAQMAFTADLAAQSTSAHHAVGICQTNMMSASGSNICSVRVFGLSKAVCGASVQAGSYVVPYRGVSTTSRGGCIQEAGHSGVSCTSATQSTTAHITILGRALQSGSTGYSILIMVNPQLYDKNLLAVI